MVAQPQVTMVLHAWASGSACPPRIITPHPYTGGQSAVGQLEQERLPKTYRVAVGQFRRSAYAFWVLTKQPLRTSWRTSCRKLVRQRQQQKVDCRDFIGS